MSHGPDPGLNQHCSFDCLENRHIIIEADYEGTPYLWGIVVGDHRSIVDKIATAVQKYNEEVDDESAFILFPWDRSKKLYLSAREFAEMVDKEAEEMQRQEAEDPEPDEHLEADYEDRQSNDSGDQFQTTY